MTTCPSTFDRLKFHTLQVGAGLVGKLPGNDALRTKPGGVRKDDRAGLGDVFN